MSKEVNWQQECLKKGFEYVREPDDHYVVASPAEMVALLRDLLGVDVRTKEGDSYGVAVSELQEQIDGLVSTIHAQQAERDALLAERDELKAQVSALHRGIKAKLPGRSLAAVGSGALHAEQNYCYRRGWKDGVAALRSQIRAALQGAQP